MSIKKTKKINRLRKKRVWPAVLLFFALCVGCFFLVTLYLGFFMGYVVDRKTAATLEESKRLAQLVDEGIAEKENVPEALEQAQAQTWFEGGIFVAKDEKLVAGDAQSSGELSDFLEKDRFMVYDLELEDGEEASAQIISEDPVFTRAVFSMDDRDGAGEQWLKEEVMRLHYWAVAPVGNTGYSLVMGDELALLRREVIYIYGLCITSLVVMMIPLVLLLINIVSAIISQRKTTQLFYTDMVTGGNNWRYVSDHGEKELKKHRNERWGFALLDVQLNKYRSYCACHGVKEGEELLEEVENILGEGLGRHEYCGHYAKANFAVLMRCSTREQCQDRIQAVLHRLSSIHIAHRLRYHVGAVWIEPQRRQKEGSYHSRRIIDMDNVYNCASVARGSLAGQEENAVAFFNQKMLEQKQWEHKVEDTMEDAMRREEFQVYLQPKYSPVEERLVGAEALVRWLSPTEGMIPPYRFIPIFEENGFVTQLDDYMISHVAKLQAQWIAQGKKVVPISVNVSRAHFMQAHLAEHICRLVDAYGTPHEVIELELTESAFFDDKQVLLDTVKKLKEYGFSVSMDDFGAGYSSLNSLKDLPLDILKLDAEFFRGDFEQDRGAIVVAEAIRLAKKLRMRIVAEGIEKKEQVDFLADLGCDMIQGYYFAKPMPVHEFEEQVKADA